MSDISRKLNKEFKDKDYAHGYMESFCVDRIASQIHALRKQRNLTQKKLSSLCDISQEQISKFENGDFDSITMSTLKKLSRAFDVNLTIKFESFSNAIDDVVNLSDRVLQVTSRDECLKNPYLGRLKAYGKTVPTLKTVNVVRNTVTEAPSSLFVAEGRKSMPAGIFDYPLYSEAADEIDSRLTA